MNLSHEGMQQQEQKSESETQLKQTKSNCEVVYLPHFIK